MYCITLLPTFRVRLRMVPANASARQMIPKIKPSFAFPSSESLFFPIIPRTKAATPKGKPKPEQQMEMELKATQEDPN